MNIKNQNANTIPMFVYGSLMEGFGNHRLLERGGAELVGVAETVKRWGFISLGAFPGIVDVHGKGSTKVVGELYMVNERTRAALDSLEGHPEFYKRAAVDVDMLTSKARDVRKCETYVLPSGYDRGAERSRVPFGDWRCYVNAQEKARRDADAYAERALLVFGDGEL